jgi:hypothetical protein
MAESSRETMTESQRPEVDIGLVKAAKGDPRAFAELYQSFVEPVFPRRRGCYSADFSGCV